MEAVQVANWFKVSPFLLSRNARVELRLRLSLVALLHYRLRKTEGSYMLALDALLTKEVALYVPDTAWHFNQTELVTRYSKFLLSHNLCLSEYA